MNNKSTDTNLELFNELGSLCTKIKVNEMSKQKEQIIKESPYSDKINEYITSYDEFFYYCSLQLKEAVVTRSALIREIDLELFVTLKGKTNRELMRSGASPFAFDDADGEIELHHIGQDINSPFAELTREEHRQLGNYALLHQNSESWRDDEFKNNIYGKERYNYWKARVDEEYTILCNAPEYPKEKCDFEKLDEVTYGIRDAVEFLFSKSTVDELNYFGELANNYAFSKTMGVNDFEDLTRQMYIDESIKCPKCNSEDYSCNGNYNTSSEKVKRYKCKNCENVFTLKQNSIISNSNLKFFDWMKLINCLYNGYSIEKTAKICGVSPRCVHDNRLKLFYALKLLDDEVKLDGNVVIDETYFPVSYKGNHSKNADFVLPRVQHKRGNENHNTGLGNDVVCVACALDETGNSVARVAGLGAPNYYELMDVFDKCIDKESVTCIYSDKAKASKCFAESKGIPIKQGVMNFKGNNPSYTREGREIDRNLQRIGSYHSRLKKFMRKFVGVSSKLLPGYLYLFAFKEREKTFGNSEFQKLFVILATPNLYKSVEVLAEEYKINTVTKFIPKATKDVTYIKNLEVAKKMGEAYSSGKTQMEIGKEFGVCDTTVRKILKQLELCGYFYFKPEKEIKKKTKKLVYKYEYDERDLEIFNLKENWTGTDTEFLDYIENKYNLKRNYIWSVIASQRKINALKGIKSSDKYEFNDERISTRETYLKIYKEFCPDLEITFDILPSACVNNIPSNQFFFIHNSYLVHRMYLRGVRRLSFEDTINRNRAICVDYLNWQGTGAEFFEVTTKKYFISKIYLYEIICDFFKANPEQYINKLEY